MLQFKDKLARRHLLYPLDFDSRAMQINLNIQDDWDEKVKALHIKNKNTTIKQLKYELGEYNFEQKLENFAELGNIPFSLVLYHNSLYHQARYSFYHGYYYPALLAATALGERILNHLILDLRDCYKNTPNYKKIYRKNSFDNWEMCIDILRSWDAFQHQNVPDNFEMLLRIRNKSIHFNEDTYVNLRNDALLALKYLGTIINHQFGYGPKKCMIKGTKGHFFIKKESESEPFVKKYLLPSSPIVGPYFSINFIRNKILFFDFKKYEFEKLSDEDFTKIYNERESVMVASNSYPASDDIHVMQRSRIY